MRQGKNPNYDGVKVLAPPPPLVTLAIVTHEQPGEYHAQRAEIVDLSISSMLAGAKGYSVELVIWVNGGSFEFIEGLKKHNPDVFIESINIGPHNARRALCRMARGKFINIADDDILYHPDWLQKQMQIIKAYPNVAEVSGSPQAIEFRRDFSPVFEFAEREPGVRVKKGIDLIPHQWGQDWAASVGFGPNYVYVPAREQTLIEHKGVKAWAHGHHMQMLGPTDVLAPFMLATEYLVDFWDIAKEISRAGYLQLTTYDRTAVHIGNVIDESIERIMTEWEIKR
jgi:glycosyltransferase involved in cell wall biosynthesis